MVKDIEQKVLEIIAEQALLSASDLSLDQTLGDLGLDSMALVECIFTIEETFDISVPFNANAPEAGDFDISTLGAITKGVVRLINGPAK